MKVRSKNEKINNESNSYSTKKTKNIFTIPKTSEEILFTDARGAWREGQSLRGGKVSKRLRTTGLKYLILKVNVYILLCHVLSIPIPVRQFFLIRLGTLLHQNAKSNCLQEKAGYPWWKINAIRIKTLIHFDNNSWFIGQKLVKEFKAAVALKLSFMQLTWKCRTIDITWRTVNCVNLSSENPYFPVVVFTQTLS